MIYYFGLIRDHRSIGRNIFNYYSTSTDFYIISDFYTSNNNGTSANIHIITYYRHTRWPGTNRNIMKDSTVFSNFHICIKYRPIPVKKNKTFPNVFTIGKITTIYPPPIGLNGQFHPTVV